MKKISTMNEYIGTFPNDVQRILEKIRHTIRKAATEAVDTISCQIPTFKLNGKYLLYFAAFNNHIGVYPAPTGNEAFKKELSPYIRGKGTVQFPLNKPVPYDLVRKIVIFRMEENQGKKK